MRRPEANGQGGRGIDLSKCGRALVPDNEHLLGPPDISKNNLTTALAVEAVAAYKRAALSNLVLAGRGSIRPRTLPLIGRNEQPPVS